MGRPRTPLTDLATFPHKYLRPQQLAAYGNIPIRTVYHHIQKGALHAVRVGGGLRISVQIARLYLGEIPQQNQGSIAHANR